MPELNIRQNNRYNIAAPLPQHLCFFVDSKTQLLCKMCIRDSIVDIMSATIMKQHNPGLSDPQLRQLVAAHIDDDSFCRYVIQQDISKIALDLREAHKDDFFSVPEDNPLEDFLQTVDEAASSDSDPEQAALAFICKRLKLNFKKLSEEEKKWLKKIAQKSDLLKNPTPQGGRK